MIKVYITIFTILFFLPGMVYSQEENRVITRIDTIEDNRLLMVQEFEVNAPLESVWKAFTTKEGWESWAVPLAEIDWKINGTVKTNYNSLGNIGDSTTIVTHIINFIPYKLITLQAEITKNFPAFMQEDEKDLFNIIEFIELSPSRTKVNSNGIGYRNNEKYNNLMSYFIKSNEQTQLKLITYLENK